MLTFGSVFSGIGGLDLGLERAGMECLWQIENNFYRLLILEKHWPNVKKYGDINDILGQEIELETVDVMAGGFPCQPHSQAGKQQGKKDDRNLWPQYFSLIRKTRPRYIVIENVLGIKNTILDELLLDLESESYTAWPLVIPACAFNAPHQRNRIFVVGHTNKVGFGRDKWREDEEITTNRNKQSASFSTISYTPQKRLERHESKRKCKTKRCTPQQNRWSTHNTIRRVVNGFPSKLHKIVHRLAIQALGDAVVPQVGEFIGETIIEHWKTINDRK